MGFSVLFQFLLFAFAWQRLLPSPIPADWCPVTNNCKIRIVPQLSLALDIRPKTTSAQSSGAKVVASYNDICFARKLMLWLWMRAIVIVVWMVLLVVAQQRSAAQHPSELPACIASLSPLGCWFAFRNPLVKWKPGMSGCKYNLGQFSMGIITKPNHTGRGGTDGSLCSEEGFCVWWRRLKNMCYLNVIYKY